MLSFKSTFSLSSFTFIKRLFSSSSLSATRVVICVSVIDISPSSLFFLRDSQESSPTPSQQSWIQLVLLPAMFLKMYSAYKLNKQGDNIQPWHTPLPICNQSVVPCPICCFLTYIQISRGRSGGLIFPSQNFPLAETLLTLWDSRSLKAGLFPWRGGLGGKPVWVSFSPCSSASACLPTPNPKLVTVPVFLELPVGIRLSP